ncbi:bifunctional 3-(3-hydroxy-phenyl)propionate/3-hydroxycinnamic acid hydroxylase MhpA [Kribbia dieselivorans]|uniref:bifunctional 3-(3-hydroxy-phenyl)propionate/3-hydroxycinnamic acid hydroxylase MhpA n=1 Tax=Kribbia dieselivorans TaxID=331526 RepID=UPI000838F2F0|nr:bifunctional 3-(3-hydroxy-phenyl)propionate/3-hydroxycinnamic acid hydroxylase [Kribbia dieselivorans]
MSTNTHHDCDVAIVGLGPVGLFSAIVLGTKGYRVVGLDRWATPYARPRAVTFDHEIARLLNSIGINADDDECIDYYDAIYRWQNANGDVLTEVDWMNQADDGWRNRYWFSQPALEERLRQIIASLPNVTLLQGHQVGEIQQDADGVTLTHRETEVNGTSCTVKEGGVTGTVRAAALIGSDGANSKVRADLGLTMQDLEFYYDWLVVDVLPNEDKEYDPPHYQVCDPVRPTTVVPGGPGPTPTSPRRRRWEFMALPGETAAELEADERVWELLAPFDVTPDNAVLERAVVWRFQAKYLDQWNVGRIALAGDAAHLMPPFAGEGMCAGLRDAANLCWHLDLILQGHAGWDSLDGYSSERLTNVRWYIDFAVDLGRTICVADPAEAAERDSRMIAEHLVQREIGPVHPHLATLGPGAWIADDAHAGRPAIAGRVAHHGRFGRFDDVVGTGWMLLSDVRQAAPLPPEQQARFEGIGGRIVSVGAPGSGADVIDVEGAYGRWMKQQGVNHLLVRPDFCVAATADTADTLATSMDTLFDAMGVRSLAGAA